MITPATAPLKIGLYPGTFDPITYGHLDVIQRALKIVDRLIVGVADNIGKSPLFSIHERVSMTSEACMKFEEYKKIDVRPFSTLLIDFAREHNATMLMRGLRAVTDFDYEFQMSSMNAKMAPDLESVFLMASEKYQFISSSFVKEIARLGGDVSHFVPSPIVKKLQQKFHSSAGSSAGSGDGRAKAWELK